MELLDCPIQPYAWGSRTAIARLQGRTAPSAGPEAELWIGAHHSAPSRLRGDGSLLELIAADPAGQLGASVAERYGPTLPFLLKVLAADEPLSLQAHPTRARAEAGYDAEEAAGVALDAPERNYKDRWPKPELLVALTPFTALCGFRDPAVTARDLDRLGVEALAPYADKLRSGGPDALRSTVADLLRWPADDRAGLVRSIGAAAFGPGAAGDTHMRWVSALAERYPTDVGVACAVLLELVALAPGDGIHQPAGRPHAYLAGTGVEVMANSDNVLRGGLTSKHVDVDELLAVLDFSYGEEPIVRPVRRGVELCYPVPAEEFRLSRVDVPGSAVSVTGSGPELLLCTAGAVAAHCGERSVVVGCGCAAWVPAGHEPIVLDGAGTVFRATIGS